MHDPGFPEPRGLQLWVDLPKEFKMVEPSYQELRPEKYGSALSTFSLVSLITLNQGSHRLPRRSRRTGKD